MSVCMYKKEILVLLASHRGFACFGGHVEWPVYGSARERDAASPKALDVLHSFSPRVSYCTREWTLFT
jgi:hypothetical protein